MKQLERTYAVVTYRGEGGSGCCAVQAASAEHNTVWVAVGKVNTIPARPSTLSSETTCRSSSK